MIRATLDYGFVIVQLLQNYLTSSCLLALSTSVLLPLHPGLTIIVRLLSIQLVFYNAAISVLGMTQHIGRHGCVRSAACISCTADRSGHTGPLQ